MSEADLEGRVEIPEAFMTELRDVPIRLASVEEQIIQLRTEMRGGFSAVWTAIAGSKDELRGEMASLATGLQAEMRSLNADTLTQMRVLHEEVLARLTLLQEGSVQASRTAGPRSRRRKTR
jgi:hypothetical protein